MTNPLGDFEALHQPRSFPFLEALSISREFKDEGGVSDLSLTLTLRGDHPDFSGRLCLFFGGVRGLKVGDLGRLVGLHIEVRSIRDQQLEDLRYQVSESEHSAFSFLCSVFSISS